MLNKKTMLACAASAGVAFGATSLSAQPMAYNGSQTGLRTEAGAGRTQMRYRTHRKHARVHQRQGFVAQPRQSYGLLDAPFAAIEGVGVATGAALAGAGAVIGGTTATVTGYPYWSTNAYGSYAYALGAYGSYAYAPGPYQSDGLTVDRGHQFYNGAAAPASQDNCAVDAGYGRLDYSIAC
jgi:hypothetical protein